MWCTFGWIIRKRCRDAVSLYRAYITVTCSQHNGFVSAALDTLRSVKFLPEHRPLADLDPVVCEVSLPLPSLHTHWNVGKKEQRKKREVV